MFKNEGVKISIISIIINIILSIFKLIAGIVGKSSAMISDSVHSLSDIISTIVVIIGINISNKQSDDSHQYGHERFEAVAALILSMILLFTGIFIGYDAIVKIISKDHLQIPTSLALVAAIISIVVKEAMYWVTRKIAKKINSSALMADAWHHRSDSLSSIGSLIGIAFSILGFPVLDKIASLVICVFILKVGIEILKDSIHKLVDKSCDEKTISKMKDLIINTDGVLNLDLLRTRLFGNKIFVDVEISADKNLTLENAHEIASNIHDKIEENIKNVKHCMVHVNPK